MIKFYDLSRLFLFIICILISIISINYYNGSKLLFITYNLVLIFLCYYSTSRSNSFFNIFLSFYIFLGFWFKYICTLILLDGDMYDSGLQEDVLNPLFINNSSYIDKVLTNSIYIFLAILFANYISNKYFFYNKKNLEFSKSFFLNQYHKYKKLCLFIFLLSFTIIGFLNFNYKISIKGMIYENDYNFFYQNLIKWLIFYGFITVSCVILHQEIIKKNKKLIFFFIIVFFEMFVSNVSILSRSMPLLLLPFFIPLIHYDNKFFKSGFNIFLILIIFFIFSFNSIFVSNKLRLELRNDFSKLELDQKKIKSSSNSLIISSEKINKEIEDKKESIDKITLSPNKISSFIFINRWVGLDSLINVSRSAELSFSLLFEALQEKKLKTGNTFYESTFFNYNRQKSLSAGGVHMKGNTLPGLISFLYYSGNIYFVVIILIVIIMIFNFIEKKIFLISKRNLIFSAFISNVIVYRIFSFGYAPMDTYLLLLSLCLSIFIVYFVSNFNYVFKIKKK